jgi:diguanylate cyclase (GGDEF)-like protein
LEQLDRELIRARRRQDAVSVLLFDLDYFKAYNDTFGHTAGDAALSSVAQILRRLVPPDSLCARYGGEEFAVMLPRTARAQGQQAAELIRAALERDMTGAARPPRAVTLSGGVASFPEDGANELELLRIAFERLYRAKRAGRNRIVA